MSKQPSPDTAGSTALLLSKLKLSSESSLVPPPDPTKSDLATYYFVTAAAVA